MNRAVFMSKRLTEHDFHELAKQRNLEWVGEIALRASEKSSWRCSRGHLFAMSYNSLQQGKYCPTCSRERVARIRANTIEDYYELAQSRGIQWAGNELPPNVETKTDWICASGHRFTMTFHNVKSGQGCRVCNINATKERLRLKPTDYARIANERGFALVGEVPENARRKTLWRCPLGHTWSSSLDNIRSNHGCPHCAGKGPKRTADYQQLATRRGFIFIGETPALTRSKTTWQCSRCMHIWLAHYNNIQTGSGCPRCSGNISKTKQDYINLATARKLEWIGDHLPKIVTTKTIWRCSERGHEWVADYDQVLQSLGCPHCQNRVNGFLVSKPQLAIHALTGGELNYRSSTTGRYCIDIALDTDTETPIAVEFDCYYWHLRNGIPEHDARRDAFLLSHGWRILRIKSGTLIPSADELNAAIERLRAGETYLEIVLPDWRG